MSKNRNQNPQQILQNSIQKNQNNLDVKQNLDNRANQLNPNNPAYYASRQQHATSIQPKNNQANMQNPNKNTNGTNPQYDQNQGNRGKQLNPNQLQNRGNKNNKHK